MIIIPRSQWGAGYSTWPPSYRSITTQIVLHHSAGPQATEPDPAAAIRQIWQEHAISNGWGDIGYHYLVDSFGNVYKGRDGGDGVIGGHDYTSNDYAEGICCVGNYMSETPTDAMIAAVSWIIGQRCQRWGLTPGPNTIIGHRDDYPTSCPGDNLYNRLPDIRRMATGQPQPTTQEDEMRMIPVSDDHKKWDGIYTRDQLLTIGPHTGYEPGVAEPVTHVRVITRGPQGQPLVVHELDIGGMNSFDWSADYDGPVSVDSIPIAGQTNAAGIWVVSRAR